MRQFSRTESIMLTMHLLFGFIILVSAVSASDLNSLTATTSPESPLIWTNKAIYDIYAAHGDLVMHLSRNATGTSIVTLRSDDNGVFSMVNERLVSATDLLKTNGKWFGFLDNNLIQLWQLDSNNNIVNETQLIVSVKSFDILADDTIIVQEQDMSAYRVRTFVSLGNGTWSETDQELYVGTEAVQQTVADVNTLVTLDTSGAVTLYSRNGNEWTFSDTFNTSTDYLEESIVYYNGNGTVCVLYPRELYDGQAGLLEFYTKVAGTWTVQTFKPSDLGQTASPFWIEGTFIDKDNWIIGGASDGLLVKKRAPTQALGSAILVRRQADLTWKPIARYSTGDLVHFGAHVLRNDNFLVFTGYDELAASFGLLYTSPLCLIRPAVATCLTVDSNTCDFDLDSTQLGAYTLNSSASCGEVTASVTGVKFSDYKFTVSYKFEKTLAAPFTCDAVLSCPVPVIPTAPTSSVPVNTNTPGKKVSAAELTSLVGASLVVVAVVALF